MLDFGMKVIDKRTGYSGCIAGRAEYDTGHILYLVSGISTTGEPIEEWIESERIEVKNI